MLGVSNDIIEKNRKLEIEENREINKYRLATRGYVLEYNLRSYAVTNNNQVMFDLYEHHKLGIQSKQSAMDAAFSIAFLILLYQFLPISSAHKYFDPARFYSAACIGIAMWFSVSYSSMKYFGSIWRSQIYVGIEAEKNIVGEDEYNKRHELLKLSNKISSSDAHQRRET